MSDPLVLHVRLVTGTGGGPDKTVLNSPRFLKRLGYDCACAYLHPPGDPGFQLLEERARQWEAPLISVPDRGPWDFKVLWALVRLCRERKVAIWHGHEYKSNVFGLLVRRFWRMKLVTTVHGWGVHAGRAPFYNGIDRRTLRFYEHVVAVSPDLRDECLRFGVHPEKCSLIHNAIDTEQYARTLPPGEAKRAVGAPSDGVLIGAVGRLSDEKRFDLLIAATAQLAQRGYNAHLWIAGEGPMRESLANAVQSHGMQERVRLLGMVDDPRAIIQACDLFALSSVREGLPNVVLEAMALETPVVATRIAGVPSLLEEGRLGVLVEPGSADSLVEGMLEVLRDGEHRVRRVAAARARIVETYSFQRRMERMVALYDRLLGRSEVDAGTPQLASA
jgi:glycosyltransferase involved in cell wall biosynthesis